MSRILLTRRLCLTALLATSLGLAGTAKAQDSPAGISATDAASLRKEREKVAARIADLSKPKKKNDAASERLSLLRALDGLYAQQQSVLERRRQLESDVKQAKEQLESLDKFEPSEPKPYSILFTEGLQDQLAAEEDRQKAVEADLGSTKKQLQSAHEELDDSQAEQTKAANPKGKSAVKLDHDWDELKTAIGRAKVDVKQAEVQSLTLELELSKTLQKQLTKKIEAVRKDTKFSAADLDKKLDQLGTKASDLKDRRQKAEMALQQLETDHQKLAAELTENKAPAQAIEDAEDSERVARDACQSMIALADQQIEIVTQMRRFWSRRRELATTKVEQEKISRWLDNADQFLEQLIDSTRVIEHRRKSIRAEEIAADADAKSLEAVQSMKQFAQARVQELRDLCATSLDDVKASQRMLERFKSELKSKLKETPASWATAISRTVHSLLGREVGETDDETVTLGTLLVLLLYILGGMVLAYSLSRFVGRHVLPRLGMHRGTVAALKSIVFYSLCIFFGVVSFQLLNVPLAAFAFLGGAAAIAVGFGGQDIMNNFMSGIILLTEQPIRVGDIVEIGGSQALVTRIGLRSTRLQTEVNHELIVPNKALLDEQVTNLTLSDNLVQMYITVTLERNVNVPDAKLQMLHAAFMHPMIVKSPRPVVLMKEFDCYYGTYTFEVRFWMEMTSFIRCEVVQSDILETISDRFPPKDADHADPLGSAPSADAAQNEATKNGATAASAEEGETSPASSQEVNQSSESAFLARLQKANRAAIAKELKKARRAIEGAR